MDDDELRAIIAKARTIVGPIRHQPAMWDVILDAEAILAGRLPIPDDRAYIEQVLSDFVK